MSFNDYEQHFKVSCKYSFKEDFDAFESYIDADKIFENFDIDKESENIYDRFNLKHSTQKYLVTFEPDNIGFHNYAKVEEAFKRIDTNTKTLDKQIKKIFEYNNLEVGGIKRIGYALVSVNFFKNYSKEEWKTAVSKLREYHKTPISSIEEGKSFALRLTSNLEDENFLSTQIKLARFIKEDADIDQIGLYLLNDVYLKGKEYLFKTNKEIIDQFKSLKETCKEIQEEYKKAYSESEVLK